MGRPKSEKKKRNSVYVRMDDDEFELFLRVVAHAATKGPRASPPGVLRWLVEEYAKAHGLRSTAPKRRAPKL